MFRVKAITGNSRIGNALGRIGEGVATRYILSKGYKLVDRNYREKWGEIDIIAEKTGILHFIEVKSVSRESKNNVTQETLNDKHRAEDNIHPAKLRRISRTIQSYLASRHLNSNCDWQFDAITVIIIADSKKAYVNMIGNLIL